MLEPGVTSGLASSSFEFLLDSLGWQFSRDSDKAAPFSESFDLLGVRMHVGSLMGGIISLENKPSRLEKMKDSFLKLGLMGRATLHDLQSLQGQVNFAVGFAAGKNLKMVQRAISNFIRRHEDVESQELAELCTWAVKLLDQCKPRVFAARGPVDPVLIFTDAAYEGGVGSYGIVAVDTATGEKYVAGGDLPDWLIEFWHRDSPDQVIGRTPRELSLSTKKMVRRPVTMEANASLAKATAKASHFVKGSSRSRTLLMLGALFFQLETADGAITWLERVPSASNIADAPSKPHSAQAAQKRAGEGGGVFLFACFSCPCR